MASRLNQTKRRGRVQRTKKEGSGEVGRGATDQENKEDQELRTLTAEMSGLHWNKKKGKGKCLGWRGLGYGVSEKN